MEGISAERALLEGAISPELAAAFRTLADADLGGDRKYSPQTIRTLSSVVAARAYGKPMLELCHLLRIAELVGGRHGWPNLVFGVPVARAAAFRARIQDGLARNAASAKDLVLADDGVTLRYADKPFHVTYGRMGFLAALVELMVTVLGFRAVDDTVRGLLDEPFDAARAPAHANALSRILYDHLKHHVTAAQSLRVFASLVGFLERNRGGGFSLDDIDDRAVFEYWLEAALGAEQAGDLRAFRSVVVRMAMLRTALDAAFERHALGAARSIGPDRSVGEVDPDAILVLLEVQDEPVNDLEELASPPTAAVKLLTQKEKGDLALVCELGRQAPVLALSVLRAETLGLGQSRVSQALRRRAVDSEVRGLIALSDCETYLERLELWSRVGDRLERMALAALGVLVELGRAEAAAEVLAWVPAADLSGLRHSLPVAAGGNVVALRPADTVDLVAALGDRTLVGDDVADLVLAAERALKGVSRAGFRPEDRGRPETAEAMALGAPVVRRLRDALATVHRAVDARLPADEAGARFDADAQTFSDGLKALYGSDA